MVMHYFDEIKTLSLTTKAQAHACEREEEEQLIESISTRFAGDRVRCVTRCFGYLCAPGFRQLGTFSEVYNAWMNVLLFILLLCCCNKVNTFRFRIFQRNMVAIRNWGLWNQPQISEKVHTTAVSLWSICYMPGSVLGTPCISTFEF